MRPRQRRGAGPTRLLLIATMTVLAVACVSRTAPKISTQGAAPEVSQLWVEPRDLEARDLFHGPGGAALAPHPTDRFEVVAVDNNGFSRGYDVRDAKGTRWSVKLGIEAQPEVVASRVLWAIGYHQPPTYLLTTWQLTGSREKPGAARFRPEPGGRKVIADWSWYQNPFLNTQPFKGLLVANLVLNNWDWKTSNNKIYDLGGAEAGPRRVFVVRDLGASLGKTTFRRWLNWPPFRGMAQGSRNDVAGFEEQALIRKVDGQRVTFDYRGIHGGLVDTLTVGDVVWTCRLLARISDRQWRDAFRAAGYADAEQQRFITKLKSKIREGLALAGLPTALTGRVGSSSRRVGSGLAVRTARTVLVPDVPARIAAAIGALRGRQGDDGLRAATLGTLRAWLGVRVGPPERLTHGGLP